MTEQEKRIHNRWNAAARLFSFGIIALICIICGIQKHYSVAVTDSWQLGYETGLKAQKLPTIQEIQERIGCEKIDGIWGEETNRLYDQALCDQYAIAVFEGEQK